MKLVLFYISLFTVLTLNAQHSDIEKSIFEINSKIQNSEKTLQLKWMDSLVSIVKYKTELQYDSIVKQTINFALKLDSLELAGNHIADLIYYKNNITGKPEEGLKLYNKYIKTYEHMQKSYALTRFYLNVADSYYYLNDVDTAVKFYNKTIKYAQKYNKTRLEGFAHLYLGYTESDMGKFPEASKSLKTAIDIFTEVKDSFNILSSKNALSILYSKNAFFNEAEKERNEAIELAKQDNRNDHLISLYFNAATDYRKIADYKKQIAYLKTSLAYNAKSENEMYLKANILAELVIAYSENDSTNLAETHFKELKQIYLNNKSSRNRESYIFALKSLEFQKSNYSNALTYGKEYLTLRKQKRGYEEIMLAEKFIAKVYQATNNLQKANEHFVSYYTLKDSITSVQNTKTLAYYQTLYETEKQDRKIEAQNTNIELLNVENKNKTQQLTLGVISMLVLFACILFYRSYTNAKHREIVQQGFSQELIKTQERERTRISKDLHDSVGQQLVLLKWKTQSLKQPELSLLVQNTLEEVRHISRDLYPITLTKLGLTNSIQKLLFELDETTDLFVTLEIDDVNTRFDDVETLNFYRFIQESVSNVIKHANASTLFVNILKQKNGIKVLIRDNGNGFDIDDTITLNSLGLKTMTERINILKGRLSIKSKKNKGTAILVQIPT